MLWFFFMPTASWIFVMHGHIANLTRLNDAIMGPYIISIFGLKCENVYSLSIVKVTSIREHKGPRWLGKWRRLWRGNSATPHLKDRG